MIPNLRCCAPEYVTPPAFLTPSSRSLSGSPGTSTGRSGSADSSSRNVWSMLWSLRENSEPEPHTAGSRAMKQWDKPPGESKRPHWRTCGPQVPPGGEYVKPGEISQSSKLLLKSLEHPFLSHTTKDKVKSPTISSISYIYNVALLMLSLVDVTSSKPVH